MRSGLHRHYRNWPAYGASMISISRARSERPVAISVRRAHARDRAFVDSLGAATAQTSISKVRPVPGSVAASAFARLVEYCSNRGSLTLIAQRDGEPCGFLILLTDLVDEVTLQPHAFIGYMAVDSPARRAGAARALIRAAEAEARRLGLPHLSLMVSTDNGAARALYESSGFVVERELMTKAVS